MSAKSAAVMAAHNGSGRTRLATTSALILWSSYSTISRAEREKINQSARHQRGQATVAFGCNPDWAEIRQINPENRPFRL